MSVVSFEKAKADRAPHMSGEARCIDCSKEWVALNLPSLVEYLRPH